MKILLCLNRDIYCVAVLNLLCMGLKGHEVEICFSDNVGKRPESVSLDKLLFYEKELPFDVIFPLLEANFRWKKSWRESGRFLTFNQSMKFILFRF